MAIMNFDGNPARLDGNSDPLGSDPNCGNENHPSDKDDGDGPVAGEDEQDEDDTGPH